eukprot:TRINITY_DN1976_c0_g1_i2.p1 TRINITY_DN1976_c0_g1~~TRINITY_DN1976_c0_g1_i2.p1  ORF type:complete len:131 (-),score=20.25 TRINITY_DN1976_c0_g1_i2:83-475(-)
MCIRDRYMGGFEMSETVHHMAIERPVGSFFDGERLSGTLLLEQKEDGERQLSSSFLSNEPSLLVQLSATKAPLTHTEASPRSSDRATSTYHYTKGRLLRDSALLRNLPDEEDKPFGAFGFCGAKANCVLF